MAVTSLAKYLHHYLSRVIENSITYGRSPQLNSRARVSRAGQRYPPGLPRLNESDPTEAGAAFRTGYIVCLEARMAAKRGLRYDEA